MLSSIGAIKEVFAETGEKKDDTNKIPLRAPRQQRELGE